MTMNFLVKTVGYSAKSSSEPLSDRVVCSHFLFTRLRIGISRRCYMLINMGVFLMWLMKTQLF